MGSVFLWINVFNIFFIWFIIVVHLVTVKKFDNCLLTGWSSTVFILLVNIFNHTFNLFINNIDRKPIIDESLFYVFYLFITFRFGGGDLFGTEYQIIDNFFFYISEGAFTFKFKGTGVVTSGFLLVEVV